MKVSAIILAAGMSSRMGGENKLLQPRNGSTVIRHVTETVLGANFFETLLVLGHDLKRVESATSRLPVIYTVNERFEEGMGSSIARGVSVASAEADGFLICLGDMPYVTNDLISAIAHAGELDRITFPTYAGKQRNPVLFGCAFRDELLALLGDQGARALIRSHPDSCTLVPWHDSKCFEDIDTPDSLP